MKGKLWSEITIAIVIALLSVGVAAQTPSSFSEAPMLAEKVEAGELPPVHERISAEPLVIELFKEVGRYGGTLRSGAFGPSTAGVDNETVIEQHILQIGRDLSTLKPNIAKGVDIADDFRSVTIHLREGMKWSDGAPFTADDFVFWYEDIALNMELTPTAMAVWQPGGEMFELSRVDDYTVRMDFAGPNPAIDIILGKSVVNGRFYAPKHYLEKWHIRYNENANELAKEEGFDNWWEAFGHHLAYRDDQQDVNQPRLTPWVLKEIDSFGNRYFERNPYYWKVDIEGNQLPYIDTVARLIVKDPEVRNLKVMAKELHFAAGNPPPLKDYPLFKSNEEKGNYTVMLFQNTRGVDQAFSFNLTSKDPVLREIFNDLRFRQAMSLAMNRQEINDVLYFGRAVHRQATTVPTTSFYEEWMGSYLTEYDPDRANALLDGMGLKWDSSGNVRLRPDGKPLEIVLETTNTHIPTSEMVAEHWRAVGVHTILKEHERAFFFERGLANERDVAAWPFDNVTEFSMRASSCARFRPTWSNPHNAAPLWQQWFDSEGESGEEPPEAVKRVYALCDEFNTAVPGTDRYKEIGREILTIHGKNMWVIGATQAPRVVFVTNDLGNTPKEGTFANDYRFWVPYQGDQWFFKN